MDRPAWTASGRYPGARKGHAKSTLGSRIAAKLAAVREGRIPRLAVNVPPRHLKSHLASVSFPAWCLGHSPSAQILCVSYAQDLGDKLSRLPPHRHERLVPKAIPGPSRTAASGGTRV